MGDWHISIAGQGCHDNDGYEGDVEVLTKKFVEELRAKGHSIRTAYVNIGARVPQGTGVEYSSGHTHDLLEEPKVEEPPAEEPVVTEEPPTPVGSVPPESPPVEDEKPTDPPAG